MAVCPRCGDDNQQPHSACTQCGWDVGAGQAPPRAGERPAPPPAKVILWLVLFGLLIVLLALVIAYVQAVNRLGR